MTTKKIKDLRKVIKDTQEELVDMIKKRVDGMEQNKDLPIEDQQKQAQLSKDELAIKNATLKAATEELKVARMNKNDSSAFSWVPHIGMNRRQARLFRKARRKK